LHGKRAYSIYNTSHGKSIIIIFCCDI